MTRLLLVVATTLLISATGQAQEATWTLDKNHSTVGFTARHLAFAKVRGIFKKFSATVKADAKTGKLTSVVAEADANSISTQNEKRDKHLRSDDFLASAKHAKVTFKTRSIKWKGDRFTAVVALTLRGKTKDVTFKGELLGVQSVNFGSGAHPRAAYEASATISRKAFGLKFNGLAEGISIVSDEVEISFEVETSLPAKK